MLMVEAGENNTKMVKKTVKMKKRASGRQVFGPVSTINTAPVAIGNSLRGSKPVVVHTKDGARVMGRDFAFAAAGTSANITGWELIGGMPVTPAVLASSTLRNFNQIYNKFKFHKINVHYITSSPTTQAGDVMFYYEKSRLEPAIDYSNSSFLNYVMSDVRTVIGPQWANHTASIVFTDDFKSTGYGATIDGDDDTQGSIYLYSKTNATNSPGYILIDYEISFRELSISPRAGIFPCIRGLFTNVVFGPNGTVTSTTGVTPVTGLLTTAGKLLDGVTNSINPVGLLPGDIFKCMLCATASTSGILNTWSTGGFTLSTLLANADAVDTTLTLDDGFTFYAKYSDTTVNASSDPSWSLHPTAAAAINNSRTFVYGGTNQTAKTFYINCWISMYSSTAAGFIQNVY